MVVKRPPGLVVARHGRMDQANTFIDGRRDDRKRGPLGGACNTERDFRASEELGPGTRDPVDLHFGHRLEPTAVKNLSARIHRPRRSGDPLAADACGVSSAEVSSQRLTVTSAQVVGVTPWNQEHRSTKPIVREDTEETLIQVEPQPAAGRGLGQQHFLRLGAQDQLG